MSIDRHYGLKLEAGNSDMQVISDLLKYNGFQCRNCIYQVYDRYVDLCFCCRDPEKKVVCNDIDGHCINILKRYDMDDNISPLYELMQRTGMDAKMLLLYLGVGAYRAAEFAALEGSDEILKRSNDLRDTLIDIMIEKEQKTNERNSF